VNSGTSIAQWIHQRFNNSSQKEIANMNNATQLETIGQHQLDDVTGGSAGRGPFPINPHPGQPTYGQVTLAPGASKWIGIGAGIGGIVGEGWGAVLGAAIPFAAGLRWHQTPPPPNAR
jgi:hypothetical protein